MDTEARQASGTKRIDGASGVCSTAVSLSV